MAGLVLLTAGERSLLGDESLEDGLDDSEWGDMGLANGEAPWWSRNRQIMDVLYKIRFCSRQARNTFSCCLWSVLFVSYTSRLSGVKST